MLLVEHGIRDDLVYSDVASGRNLQCPGWQELMTKVQEGDTIVVAFLDRLSRSFEDGVRTQAELTRRNIGIVAIRGNIDTREGARRRNSPTVVAGPGGLPGGFSNRADPVGAGPGPRQREAGGPTSGAQLRTGRAVPTRVLNRLRATRGVPALTGVHLQHPRRDLSCGHEAGSSTRLHSCQTANRGRCR